MASFSDILLIGGAAYLLARRTGANIAQQISVAGNIRFQVTGAGTEGVNFRLSIPVRNNSNVSIPVGRFDGQLFYGVEPVTRVRLNEPVTLTAGQSTWMMVDGQIDITQLPQTLQNIWQSGQFIQSLYLRGNIYYRVGGQEIALPVNYQVFQA